MSSSPNATDHGVFSACVSVMVMDQVISKRLPGANWIRSLLRLKSSIIFSRPGREGQGSMRVRLWRVPDAKIGHLGVGDCYDAAGYLRLKGHFLCHILQDNDPVLK